MGKDSQLVPRDFATAVKDIKLAILQARAKAARLANAEALSSTSLWAGIFRRRRARPSGGPAR